MGDPKAAEPTWAGWDVDEESAKVWADRLRSALADALPLHTVAVDWSHAQANHPRRERRRRDDGPETGLGALIAAATAFLTPYVAAMVARMRGVLDQAVVDGWWIGQQAAHAMHSGNPVAWGDWKPGQQGNARQLIEDQAGLRRFLAGLDVDGLARTRVARLASVMARAVDEDWTADRVAAALRDVLDDPNAALTTTTAVVVAASGAAALAVYEALDVAEVRWVTEADNRVCPICDANSAAGPVKLGDPFPSGDPAPPAHPRCRCAVIPS